MDNVSLIDLEIPLTAVRCKEQSLQDDKPFIVYEYDCSESVQVLSIEEHVPQHTSDLGVDLAGELVSATISFSFKSVIKEDAI
jgi:hypothetical protein